MQTLDAAGAAMAGVASTDDGLIIQEHEYANYSCERTEHEWLIQQELSLIAEQANDLLRLSRLIEPLKLSVRD